MKIASTSKAPPNLTNFVEVYKMPLPERVALVQHRVQASDFKKLISRMDAPQGTIAKVLRIPVATVNRKATRGEALDIDDSERVVNMAALIGQVQLMVEQSGDPAGFDAAKWLAHWIEEPSPALDGKRPAEYLDTTGGFAVVSELLRGMQSGAYW
jgi:putative toxin-antitoxin system antitoxin component (TIGR02293 family)